MTADAGKEFGEDGAAGLKCGNATGPVLQCHRFVKMGFCPSPCIIGTEEVSPQIDGASGAEFRKVSVATVLFDLNVHSFGPDPGAANDAFTSWLQSVVSVGVIAELGRSVTA